MAREFDWLTPQKAMATQMYEAGAPLREIAGAVGRSEDSIRRAVGRWKLHRPEGHIGVETRENLVWPRIKSALAGSTGMTVSDMCRVTGCFKSVVLRAIAEHRAEIHVARWQPTSRKPAAVWALGSGVDAVNVARKPNKAPRKVNPWLVASGLVVAPAGETGRIFKQSMSVKDDELEAA